MKNQLVTKLVGPTKKAATAAVKSFDKHIAPMVRNVCFFSLVAAAFESGPLIRVCYAPRMRLSRIPCLISFEDS